MSLVSKPSVCIGITARNPRWQQSHYRIVRGNECLTFWRVLNAPVHLHQELSALICTAQTDLYEIALAFILVVIA